MLTSNGDLNAIGQPIGSPLPNWQERRRPPRSSMVGRCGRLEILDPDAHSHDLWQAFSIAQNDGNWTYLPYAFTTFGEFEAWIRNDCIHDDPLFHVIVDSTTRKPVGLASYLRIEPKVGVIEVGHIHYAPSLQRTTLATEAMFLMMSRVFDELGYRRYEWKCDSLNAPSRNAALRLGFTFEGIFRQATVYKGRNRDTAWFSVTDSDWPSLKAAHLAWLKPENHDENNNQRQQLSHFVKAASQKR
jgi:RimJ/RimL family protein N-acetyltransferase